MKKVSLLIVSLLLIIPISVKAADPQYKVESLDATVSGSTISYNGTMEDGATAVKCWLYEGTTELNAISSAVDTHKFEGTFTAPKAGDYKVSCANYEGGDVKSVDVKVETESSTEPTETTDGATTEDTTTSKTSKNPKTADNISLYITLSIVSLMAIGTVAYKLKEN